MSDQDLEIEVLCGELALCREELDRLRQQEEERIHGDPCPSWWAEEMLFWRTKYLREHPEHATKDYVRNARVRERIDVMMFL